MEGGETIVVLNGVRFFYDKFLISRKSKNVNISLPFLLSSLK